MNLENIFESNQTMSNGLSFDEFDESDKNKLAKDLNNFSLNLPMLEYTKLSACNHCSKDIFNFEVNVEFGEHFYHKECFKCKCCSANFFNQKDLPIKDASGSLYCLNDFIR